MSETQLEPANEAAEVDSDTPSNEQMLQSHKEPHVQIGESYEPDDHVKIEKSAEDGELKPFKSQLKNTLSIIQEVIQAEEKLTHEDEEGSDSDGSWSSAASYLFQKDLPDMMDFFAILGDVPDFEDFADLTDESLTDVDRGRFTELLDEVYEEPEVVEEGEEEFVVEEEQAAVVDEVEEVAEEEEEEEEEDDDLLLAADDDITTTKKDEEFVQFFESTAIHDTHFVDEMDFEGAMEREEHKRQVDLISTDFLNYLINLVINTCEFIDKNSILRQTLDKMKLSYDIQSQLIELEVEQRARVFLNRKVVEYYRRKKTFRAITDDNPDTVVGDMEKYRNAITNLDQLMARELDIKTRTTTRISDLQAELITKEEQVKIAYSEFEDMIRKTLVRENFERLRGVVNYQLNIMVSLRRNISKVRLLLIERLHSVASLMEKLDKLENLGNGLHMNDFEHLQAETQALNKKIEERNSDLHKFRARCNADLHFMAHMREKQQMLRNTTTIQDAALVELFHEKKDYREHLFKLKVERGKIRTEILDLSLQGGLLDKPGLMLDYDETVSKLSAVRLRVENLRKKINDINDRMNTVSEARGYSRISK